MTFPNNIKSNSPKPYKFVLINLEDSSQCECNVEPIGWENGTWEIDRKVEIGGVFSKFTVGSLRFVGNGAKFLRDIWDKDGFNGRCDLHIYWYRFSTQAYVEFPSALNINFACKPRVKVGRFSIGIEVEAINNETKVKLDNRKKTDVDITKTISIGGYQIVDYPTEFNGLLYPLMKEHYFHNSAYNLNGALESTGSWILQRKPGVISYVQLPLSLLFSDFSETQKVSYVVQIENVSAIDPFFKNAVKAYYCNVAYDISIDVRNKDNDRPWEILLIETDSDNNFIQEFSLSGGVFGSTKEVHTYKGSVDLTFGAIGNNLVLAVRVADEPDISAFLTHAYIKVHAIELNVASRWLELYPLFNAFERVLQHNLDYQFPFWSDYLSYNTADAKISKNLSGDVYANKENEQLVYFSIGSGLNFRGGKISDENIPMAVNFDKLYNAASAILNLGYIIQNIEGFDRVRIEQFSWFFDDTVVLDLSDRVKWYDIETEAMPELAYSKIKTGFNAIKHDEAEGRNSYINEQDRTTIVNTDTELNIKCELRADPEGIKLSFNNHLEENGTTDVDGDNDIFILKTQHYPGGWKPETNENIEILNGSANTNVENAYNLIITGLRNMLRNGSRIKTSLTKFLTSVVRFQSSDKLQTLETSGDGHVIKENQDIAASYLDDPIYLPEKATVTCDITKEELNSLFENLPNGKPKLCGIVKFTDEIFGYWLNGKIELKGKKITISILKKYV